MPEYIELGIETDPNDILTDAQNTLKALVPGWEPSLGGLAEWLLESATSVAAQARDTASRMPTSAFRWYGAKLIGVQPIDATPAITTTTWTMRDNAGYTIPAGTQVGIDSGGETIAFETVADVAVPAGNVATTAGQVQIAAINPGANGSGLGSVGGAVQLLDPLDFVTAITMTAVTTGGVDAETDADYLDRLASTLQLIAPRPILPRDFVLFARNIAGVYRAIALDGYNPIHNLLTANQASAETDASGWANATNATIASTAAQAADGAKSVSMTSVAAGDMAIYTTPVTTVPVNPGETITALASFRSAVTARTTRVGVRWWTSAGVYISDSYEGGAADSAAAWRNGFVTAVAPATAGRASVIALVLGTGGVGEVHYVDKASLRRGTGVDWVAGGTAETGNERMIAIADMDSAGAAVSAPVAAAVQADLDGRREINFVVYTINPATQQIAVTYTVKARSGYDLAALVVSVNAALTAYLSAVNWGVPPSGDVRDWDSSQTVRYLEIAQVINNVEGVDYITTTGGNYDLTIGYQGGALARTDLTLPGPIGLPAVGTLTGVAT